MKQLIRIVGTLVIGMIMVTGCAKTTVNTSKLEKSFKAGQPAQQSMVDKVVTSAKAGDYGTAMASLQQLANQAKLTPEQEQAIRDVMTQVQEQMTKTANKAVGDLQKSLPK